MPLNLALIAPATVTQAGTLTAGSATVEGLDTTLLAGAVRVGGAGIAPGTVVAALADDTTLTLSRPATASGTVPLAFGLFPLSVAEAKVQCRIDITDDDSYIGDLIARATRYAENSESRAFVTSTWQVVLDSFPFGGGYYNRALRQFYGAFPGAVGATFPGFLPLNTGIFTLPRSPLVDVTEIRYRAPDGHWALMDPATYVVVAGSPGRVSPAYGQIWPTTQPQVGSVALTFTAGYGPDARSVPDHVKAAVGLMVGHLYENREAIAAGTSFVTVPDGFRQLLGGEEWGKYM